MANQVHGPEGMIFANKYRIVKLIGSGGMANVYLGIDMNTGANVAIKILKPEFSSDDEFIRRFDAEAKSVASLNMKAISDISFRNISKELPLRISSTRTDTLTGRMQFRSLSRSVLH